MGKAISCSCVIDLYFIPFCPYSWKPIRLRMMGNFQIFSRLQEKLFANLRIHYQKQIIVSIHHEGLTPFPLSGLELPLRNWYAEEAEERRTGSSTGNEQWCLSTDWELGNFYNEEMKRIRSTFPQIRPGFPAPSPRRNLRADVWVWEDHFDCFFPSQLQICSCGRFLEASSKPTLNAQVSGTSPGFSWEVILPAWKSLVISRQ